MASALDTPVMPNTAELTPDLVPVFVTHELSFATQTSTYKINHKKQMNVSGLLLVFLLPIVHNICYHKQALMPIRKSMGSQILFINPQEEVGQLN